MASNAIVARLTTNGISYLKGRVTRADWVSQAYEAETFANMHEATRAALVLPGALRAFALPLASGA